jgi:hypothetical protein
MKHAPAALREEKGAAGPQDYASSINILTKSDQGAPSN